MQISPSLSWWLCFTSSWSPECAFRCLKLSLVQLCISKGSFPATFRPRCAQGHFRLLFSAERCSETFIRARLSLSPTPPSGQTARPPLASVSAKATKTPLVSGKPRRRVKTPVSCSKKTVSALSLSPHFYPRYCTNIFALCFS
jgi:hypothetical protein